MEVPQRFWVIRNLKSSERFGSGESFTDVVRRFDPQMNTLSENFTIVTPSETQTYLLRYHLFDWEELKELLEKAGFEVIKVFGSYGEVPLEDDSPVMLLVTSKPSHNGI